MKSIESILKLHVVDPLIFVLLRVHDYCIFTSFVTNLESFKEIWPFIVLYQIWRWFILSIMLLFLKQIPIEYAGAGLALYSMGRKTIFCLPFVGF